MAKRVAFLQSPAKGVVAVAGRLRGLFARDLGFAELVFDIPSEVDGNVLARWGCRRRGLVHKPQPPGVFEAGGAALQGQQLATLLARCFSGKARLQALLHRQAPRFKLDQNEAGGVVAVAGVARVKAGFFDQPVQRVVGKVVAGVVLVEQGRQAPCAVVLVLEFSTLGVAPRLRQAVCCQRVLGARAQIIGRRKLSFLPPDFLININASSQAYCKLIKPVPLEESKNA